ncbi:hypothetical protein Poly59_26290 [Rubripirellula reticaptiva]|uniref:Uncharacterized protein n=1 Tax=Rubripirellula reticaptiva TaxID=2528013 RepID=A0A5C6F545_9BACT|nr:hypothetical protein Poly59_26290 [Rubripirellula reticaptiva]
MPGKTSRSTNLDDATVAYTARKMNAVDRSKNPQSQKPFAWSITWVNRSFTSHGFGTPLLRNTSFKDLICEGDAYSDCVTATQPSM